MRSVLFVKLFPLFYLELVMVCLAVEFVVLVLAASASFHCFSCGKTNGKEAGVEPGAEAQRSRKFF